MTKIDAFHYIYSMQIRWARQARKDLDRLPPREAQRVLAAVAAAARGDANADVKKLVGREGIRIRAGDWRVIAAVDGEVMEIRRVAPRGEVYKR